MMNKIKLFVSDVDGTLTDGIIYYSKDGEELKKFSCRDGRGFFILDYYGVRCALLTAEKGGINKARFEKLNLLGTVGDFIDGVYGYGKLDSIEQLCKKYKLNKKEVAYIGDDTGDLEALEYVGYKACPNDANPRVKKVKEIKIMKAKGGYGAVREYIDYLVKRKLI